MDWKRYFTGTILDRGKAYYRKGNVGNIEKVKDKFCAVVEGSFPYHVTIWKKANQQLGMSCNCMYALDGNHCKHMAAVCMKIEEELGMDALYQMELQLPKNVDRQVQPFEKKNVKGAKEYVCFDLADITDNIQIMESQVKEAKKLIEKNRVELQTVAEGSMEDYYGNSVPLGMIQAYCKDSNGTSKITMRFTSHNILEAICRVPNCEHFYSESYSYGKSNKKLCKHQLAVLFLLEDYIEKYNPGDTTDTRALELIEKYQKKHQGNALAKAEAEVRDLQIEPRMERTKNGLEISFRTGTKKLYVIKSLDEFVEKVENKLTQAFSSTVEINYGVHQVSPKAERYYAFIRKTVREEQLRLEVMPVYFDEGKIGNKIPLYGSRLDEIFELLLQESADIPFHDKIWGEKYNTLFLEKRNPNIQLTLRNDYENSVFRGIEVSGDLPEFIKGEQYLYYLQNAHLYRIDKEKDNVLLPLIDTAINNKIKFHVGRKALTDFCYYTLPMLAESVSIIDKTRNVLEQYVPPKPEFRFYLDEDKGAIFCEAKVVYGEEEYALTEDALHMQKKNGRDSYAEREVVETILHYCSQMNEKRTAFLCEGDDAICGMLENGIRELMGYGEVLCTDRVKRIHLRKQIKMSVGVSLEGGLMELEISTDDIAPKELLELLASYRKKKKYHRLSNGDFVNTEDENLSMLASMMDSMQISAKDMLKGKMQVPAYRALYLDKVLEKNETLYVERDKHFKQLIKEFKTTEESDFEVPISLQKIMRPYQTTGFKWFKTLEHYGFGGILADDMGLGKTLQVISVLLQAKEESKQGVSLIVTPASLIYNWQEEFKKFAPQMKIQVISGTQTERRNLISEYQAYDVLITSYDLLKRDIAEYEDKNFLYQVIDEAQYIKNHSTAAAKAVKCIQSRIKYALTGTPIENRLSELWSIFDYLMPGFLYGYETFRKEMETPIVKNKDEDSSLRLKRMVSPFVLRRLKQDVLKELPDKLEEIQYTMFGEKQQHLYDAQVTHMRAVLNEQNSEEFAQNKIQILSELTKLREICCDPNLLYENYDGESAKRSMCMDLIKRAIEGEHRILIFSQFTSMLQLLEKDLCNEGIAFSKITGATKKEERIQLVKQFNEGTIPVFLISLKAGGTGLNLIGADTVIHYDPWWNQAVQNQATDRAHRIGQKKVVTVYKLIAKGSIEEKILQMQDKKKNLADEILSGETRSLAQMSREELLELLG